VYWSSSRDCCCSLPVRIWAVCFYVSILGQGSPPFFLCLALLSVETFVFQVSTNPKRGISRASCTKEWARFILKKWTSLMLGLASCFLLTLKFKKLLSSPSVDHVPVHNILYEDRSADYYICFFFGTMML
jgi:hypothetical protein